MVGPERDLEAVKSVPARFDARFERGCGAAGLDELGCKLDFESGVVVSGRGYPGKRVAWQQSKGELVRVLEDDRVIGWQIEPDGERQRRVDGSGRAGWIHRRILESAAVVGLPDIARISAQRLRQSLLRERSLSARERNTQNSLPSGSAMTTQVTSACPMSTRRAPRLSSRRTSACWSCGRRSK